MPTFSLLQISLDQVIGRDSFLEAAAGAETVANTGILQPESSYPSMRAYEDGIRWSFHHIAKDS
jgi:hypothetical protein